MKNYIFLLLKSTFFVILIFVVVSFMSCRQDNPGHSTPKRKIEVVARYKPGDVVYLKPDSIKAVIVRKNRCGCNEIEYTVHYYNKNQERHTVNVQEASIY